MGINIEDDLLPENGKLIFKDELATAKLLDAELDELKLSFQNDGCVDIDVSSLSYVKLSIDNLEDLIRLIYEAEEKYNEIL